jgi:ribulose-5-phosphate 4-epimerase/fuculose-1-phosphate aldolase
MTAEQGLRALMVFHGRSLFERRFTCGGSGSLSARLPGGGILMTPTGASLGRLDPERLARLDPEGRRLDGDAPSKEWPLHLAVLAARADAGAVVHLHPPHAVAVSCLNGLNPDNVLPPLTPYFVMRIGRLPLIPYHPPGDPALAAAAGRAAARARGMLLAQHGIVAWGRDLDDAVANAEELEETARLFLLLRREDYAVLSHDAVAELLGRRSG